MQERFPPRRYDHTWTDRQIMHYEGFQACMDILKAAAEGVPLPED